MSVTTRAHSDSALLLCLAETNGSGGCPRNHVCELGQNRKRTHTPWQALSHLGDALHIPIAEKLGGLRQVRDAVRIESHKPRAGEVGRHWVVRHHDSP